MQLPGPSRTGDRKRAATLDNAREAWRTRATIVILIAVALASLDWAFAGTCLITPVSPVYLWAMRLTGALAGLYLAWQLTRSERKRMAEKLAVAAACLVLPFLAGALFNGIAWNMADRWYFGLSSAPLATARYPIQALWIRSQKAGRNGYFALQIDPYATGEPASIPIGRRQFDAIEHSYRGLCVKVAVRQASDGAVQVRSPSVFFAGDPDPLEIAPCAAPTSTS